MPEEEWRPKFRGRKNILMWLLTLKKREDGLGRIGRPRITSLDWRLLKSSLPFQAQVKMRKRSLQI
jgi:hypothetical protein